MQKLKIEEKVSNKWIEQNFILVLLSSLTKNFTSLASREPDGFFAIKAQSTR